MVASATVRCPASGVGAMRAATQRTALRARAAPRVRGIVLLGAVAMLLVEAFDSLSFRGLAGGCRHSSSRRTSPTQLGEAFAGLPRQPGHGAQRAWRRAAEAPAEAPAEASTAAAAPEGSAAAPTDSPAGMKKVETGGKRLRQFLALEPLDDDPTGGNQWEQDEKSKLTDEEARKKLTALITGLISLAFAAGYAATVFFIDNVDFKSETTLSKEEIAYLQSSQ
mmetsp:Transcript_6191/g.16529  ORF Transcript_6191/g.16529 Transcript_6191/m.16529 type:complete len:223 (-) Transcript_6191:148-816(-)